MLVRSQVRILDALTGKLIVTGAWDGSVRVWDTETGKAVTDIMKHGAQVSSALFSPDGQQIATASEDGTARVWDVMPVGPSPEWLPRLAEAIAAQRLDRRGFFEALKGKSVEEIKEIKDQLSRGSGHDDWTRWGRWFFADRSTRTISPFSKLTVPEHIENRVKEGASASLNEAEQLAVGNAESLKQIERRRATLPAPTASPPDRKR